MPEAFTPSVHDGRPYGLQTPPGGFPPPGGGYPPPPGGFAPPPGGGYPPPQGGGGYPPPPPPPGGGGYPPQQDPYAQQPVYGQGPPPPQPPPVRKGMWYLWGALIGLALALVFLLVFYKVFYPGLARDAQLATIDPGTLQQSNIDTLQAEIDAYKAALAGDVCLAPPLADSAPLFRPRGGPEGGADGGTAAGDGASRSVPGMPPPVNPEAGDAVEAATVLVLAQGTDGTGHGTGFFINDRQVLTNRHVVEDAMDGGTVHVTSKALGTAVPARVVAITPDTEVRDYAVLEIAQPVPHGKLKLQSQAQRRERVGAYGYPILDVRSDPAMQSFLNEGTFTGAPEVIFTDGVISVIHRGQGTPSIINHTADVSQGNSGGPLVNAAGDVLGINTKIRLDQKSNRQVNMSLGADDIMQFLRSNGISFDVAGSA